MGHFFVENQRFQVTDTPGLLRRSDDERNNIEKLTLAALSHLPTAILYVHDLTGDCGTTVPDQVNPHLACKSKLMPFFVHALELA
jgi:nucleolar GTP-binding protein